MAYFEKESFISILESKAKMTIIGGVANGYYSAIKMLEALPAADVAEVKHGHWIRKDYKPCGHDYVCSVCGFGVPMEYKHCPECTARMDGAAE